MANILVLDDDELIVATIVRLLKKVGHNVIHAGDGEKGLKALALMPFDLLLTDIIMPEKDGIETIIVVRQQNPAIRIIAMSGGGRIGSTAYLNAAGKLGANATLSKPFTGGDLLAAVEAQIGQAQIGRAPIDQPKAG